MQLGNEGNLKTSGCQPWLNTYLAFLILFELFLLVLSLMNWINFWLVLTLYLYEDPVFKFWKLYLDSFGEPTEAFKWTHMPESIKLYCWRHHFTLYLSPGNFLLGSQSDFPSGRNVLMTFYFSMFFLFLLICMNLLACLFFLLTK